MSNSQLRSIEIDESKLDEYVLHLRDAAFHASLFYFVSKHKSDPGFNRVHFLTHTLLPSPFPRAEFEFAIRLQKHWNKLLDLAARDSQLIFTSLKPVIQKDEFIARLWKIYESTLEESKKQPVTINIMRSDYFLDTNKLDKAAQSRTTALSQVEINTLGCGGTATPTKMVELHKYILKKVDRHEYVDKLAENHLQENIVKGLIQAWRLYNNPEAMLVMAIRVKPYIYGDHRLIEYKLLELEPNIKFIRLTLGEIHDRAKLDDQMRLFIDGKEVGLLYYRTGYDPSDYPTEKEWAAREMIERSRAIKGPKIGYQLVGTKKFQQYLFETETMERLINDESIVSQLRSVFVQQYSFGQDRNKELIEMMKARYSELILKPQREGGGNNIYGLNIKKMADEVIDETDLESFVLMERIRPVEHFNYLVNQFESIKRIKVVTELGIFGITINGPNNELCYNDYSGFTFTTKDANCDEGGIMAGYGGYDTIFFND